MAGWDSSSIIPPRRFEMSRLSPSTMLNGEVHMRASLFGVVCIALLGAAFGPPAPPRQQKDPQKFAITIACPGTGEDRRGTTGQPLTACGTTDDKTIPVFG